MTITEATEIIKSAVEEEMADFVDGGMDNIRDAAEAHQEEGITLQDEVDGFIDCGLDNILAAVKDNQEDNKDFQEAITLVSDWESSIDYGVVASLWMP